MEKVKGYKYEIEGHSKLEDFSKGILALTNLKSNHHGIVDFKTFEGSQKVEVIATHDNEEYLTNYVGKINSKKNIDIYIVDKHVLTVGDAKTIDEINRKEESDDNYEYYIQFVSDLD